VESWINNKNVKAFLNAGLPGQESGNAIVDVLFGAVNPSGRLPYTWAKKESDYPGQLVTKAASPTAVPQITYSEGLFVDCKVLKSAFEAS
jgi:beta-glucosidase